MKEISKAIIAVMKEVKNIEKGMTVGTETELQKGTKTGTIFAIIEKNTAL